MVAFAAIGDGLRIVQLKGTLGALQAGGYLLILGIVLACLLVAYAWQERGTRATAPWEWRREAGLTTAISAFFGLSAYALLLSPLGYLAATALFFIGFLRWYGRYPWIPTVLASALVAIGSAYLWASLGLVIPLGVIPWP